MAIFCKYFFFPLNVFILGIRIPVLGLTELATELSFSIPSFTLLYNVDNNTYVFSFTQEIYENKCSTCMQTI